MDFQKFLAEVRKALGLPEDANLGEAIRSIVDLNARLDEIKAGAEKRQTELDAIVEEVQGRLERKEKLGSNTGNLTIDEHGKVVPAISERSGRIFQAAFRCMIPESSIDPKVRAEAQNFLRELNITTGSAGGYLIPTEEGRQFLQLVNVYSNVRQLFTVVPMSTAGPLTMPALNGDMLTYWVDEHEAPNEGEPSLKQFSITNKMLAALTHLSLALIQDSNPAALQLVMQSMARAFAKEEARVGFVGKSVADGGSDKYTGLFNLTGATASALSAGKTSIQNIGLKDLTNAINAMVTAVGEVGLQGAAWHMHPTVLTVIEDLVDSTGRPLVRDAREGNVQTLRGYPVRTIESAPALSTDGAGKPFISFCNPAVMAVGDRQQVEIAQDSSVGFKNFQLVVRGMERIGFAPMHPAAVVTIKTAAS